MKIQDLIFLFIFAVAFITKKPRFSLVLGLICLALAIPLFAKWIFFTAERLTWYAVTFFLLAIIQILWSVKNENRH